MCRLEKRGNVFVLTLTGNGEHRFSPTYLDSILSGLAEVSRRSEEACALITTNEGKYFSNGLDLDWVSSGLGDREIRFELLGTKFRQLFVAMMSLKLPTIAAVCGHASAGGFIFALAHDYIFMRKDRGFLYMSEVDVGIPIPPEIMSVIRSKLTPSQLVGVVLGGRKFTAQMALEEGFIDSAHGNSAETLEAAISAAIRLGARNWNKDVYLATRLRTFPEATELLRLEGDFSLMKEVLTMISVGVIIKGRLM